MKFRAVIFDLDDTLYEEFTFVRKGYETVADHLVDKFQADRGVLLTEMLTYYQAQGRDKLFDHLLKKYPWGKNVPVAELLKIYRMHPTDLVLYEDARLVLDRLKQGGIKTGVITDGFKAVQKAKYDGLVLDQWIEHAIFTDDLGPGKHKPSPLAFEKMCQVLKVDYADACYVGDNPAKDFLAGNQLGMVTVRLKRGMHRNASAPGADYEAKHTCNHLEEIFEL